MRDAVADYHELLSDESLAAASVEALGAGQTERGLAFGEHPLSVALRPRLVSRDAWNAAVAAAQSVYDALQTLESVLLGDAELRAELDLSAEEEELALADSGVRASSTSSRLDSFVADEVRYVEYNAESPAGMAYGDELAEVFEAMPVMREFRRRWHATYLPVRERQLAAMLQAFREWGRDHTPRIAIVDWAGLPTLSEFEMFERFFEDRGVDCCICEPGSLSWDGSTLRACDGEPVNLVYRRVLTTELLAKGDETADLRRAYLAGGACVVNPFRAKLLHKKMSLALLSDDAYASLYTPAERAAIARHIPWTRKVRDGRTGRFGEEIDDLLGYVCKHREELVLKPNDEYGGKGVVLGWTTEDHEWEQAVQVASLQSYVVQEAIPIPREQYPVAIGDSVELLDLAVDMDPYVFAGEVAGCLTRLSSSALLNVTAGAGSVVPTYIVDGPVAD